MEAKAPLASAPGSHPRGPASPAVMGWAAGRHKVVAPVRCREDPLTPSLGREEVRGKLAR